MSSGYFDIVFASSGTRTAVPEAAQPDGSVSYTNGYGIDYTLDPAVNPSALNVEQDKFNQLMYDITLAIQYFQQGNAAAFITSAMNGGSSYSYPAGAVVLKSGTTYRSLVGSNTDTPPSAKWVQVTTGRIVLTGSTNYYVATTGNDSNPGTIGSPWLTIQHALDYIIDNVDLAGQSVAVNVGPGTYAPFNMVNPFTGGGSVRLSGDTTTPSNCIISSTVSGGAGNVGNNSFLNIEGFKIVTSGGGGNGLVVSDSSIINLTGKMEFGVCNNAQLYAFNNGTIIIVTDYIISGNAVWHWLSDRCSVINIGAQTLTISGTPAFSSAFAQASNDANIDINPAPTFSGSATGVRYIASANGSINTQGGGATFLPGNAGGSTSTGGQYI